MKKGFVILSILLMLALTGSIPVKADEFANGDIATITPAISQSDYNLIENTGYLVEFLRQGGSIDLTSTSYTTSDELIDDLGNFIKGTINTFLGYDTQWANPFKYTGINLPVNITNDFLTMGIEVFRNGLTEIESSEPSEPSPTPPIEYEQYIDIINGRHSGNAFFFYDNPLQYDFANGQYTYRLTMLTGYPATNYSWLCYSNGYFGYNGTSKSLCCSPLTLNIYSVDNIYYLNVITDVNAPTLFSETLGYNETSTSWAVNFGVGANNSITLSPSTYLPNQTNINIYTSGTLTQVLDFCCSHFRNVNIVVDGVKWSQVFNEITPYIPLGNGTYIEDTNKEVQWKYDDDIYIDIEDIKDRLDTLIQNQNKITFPDFEDLILDVNGQRAVAVTVIVDEMAVDDQLVKDYGTLIPLFPVFVSWSVEPETIANVATVGIVNVIPNDLITVFAITFLGMLFVTWIHRLIE